MSGTCVFCGRELTKEDEERLNKSDKLRTLFFKAYMWNKKTCKSCVLDFMARELGLVKRIMESLNEELEFLEKFSKREIAAELK